MRRLSFVFSAAAVLVMAGAASGQETVNGGVRHPSAAVEPASRPAADVREAAPAAPANTQAPGTSAADRFSTGPATREAAAARINGVQSENAMAKPAEAIARAGHHTGRSSALMIVGGAGIVLGALIGGQAGNILMLGSGAVGLYGLYLYLQ